jgi:mono/diheme cytochrome c family protein
VTPFRRLPAPPKALSLGLLGVVLLASGCGGKISADDANKPGAVLFNQRCSGCHSLKAANAYGSKPQGKLANSERTNGPNFNQRKEQKDDVLFAIRNGGFSGAIMPANIVVGKQAQQVAEFLAKYSGKEAGK